jgi:hypothetical protein
MRNQNPLQRCSYEKAPRFSAGLFLLGGDEAIDPQ